MKANETFLGFFLVDREYADFLRDPIYGDTHVPFTEYEKRQKFFIGVVLKIGNHKYFAPITSYCGVDDATFNIVRKHGEIISSVRLNFMFPIADNACRKLDIPNLKPVGYRNLVLEEYIYCNKYRNEICALAQSLYESRLAGKGRTHEGKYIINFKRLERRASSYQKGKKVREILDYILEIQRIKDVKRYGSYKEIFHESVAAHGFLLVVLATKLIDELKLDLDYRQVIKLILTHDFGEIGLEFDFANVATVTEKEKRLKDDVENAKIKTLASKYGEEIQTLHSEYTKPKTREGLFVKALDKIEPMFFLITRGVEHIYDTAKERRACAVNGNKAVKDFPELIPFYKELQSRMKSEYQKAGHEWEKEYEL